MYERYHHDVVGVNSRLDSIQAAVLDIKLKHLDVFSSSRQDAARHYNEALGKSKHIQIPKTETHKACDNSKGICDTCDCHVFHQYTIKIKNGKRDELVNHFKEKIFHTECIIRFHSTYKKLIKMSDTMKRSL